MEQSDKIQKPEVPFNITFSCKENSIKLTLNNPEDILKIGLLFSEILNENGINHIVEKINNNETLHN
jgi:hypothetical protein